MDISGKVVHVGGFRQADGEKLTARIEGKATVGDRVVDVALSLETVAGAPIKFGDVATVTIGETE